ncbi:Papilin [Dirofilaria immitis]
MTDNRLPPICIIVPNNTFDKDHSSDDECLIFYGSNIEVSTFLVKTKDEIVLRKKLLEWKHGLRFLRTHNIIAFHIMENETLAIEGTIFREIFDVEPFSIKITSRPNKSCNQISFIIYWQSNYFKIFNDTCAHVLLSNSIRHNVHAAPNLRVQNENYMDINSEKFLISEMNNIIPITTTSIILTESDLLINTKVLNLDNSQENDDNDEENSIMIDNIRRFEPLLSLPELCLLPEDAGPCFGEILRWRYNSETNHCETFIYTGCNHNANYFTSEEACLRACGEYRKIKNEKKFKCEIRSKNSHIDSADNVFLKLWKNIRWQKNGVLFQIFNDDQRIHMNEDHSQVHITNTHQTDVADYSCSVGKNTILSNSIHLDVKEVEIMELSCSDKGNQMTCELIAKIGLCSNPRYNRQYKIQSSDEISLIEDSTLISNKNDQSIRANEICGKQLQYSSDLIYR